MEPPQWLIGVRRQENYGTTSTCSYVMLTSIVTRSHKFTDRDHAGIADGTAERETRLPKFFGKSGHADTDPTKTKKGGSGKGNW